MFRKYPYAKRVRVEPERGYTKLARRYPTKFDALITFEEEGHKYFYKGEPMSCPSVSSLAKRFHPDGAKMNMPLMANQSSKMMKRKTREWFAEIWANTSGSDNAFTLFEPGEFEPNEFERKRQFEHRLLVHLREIERFEQIIVEKKRPTVDEALADVVGFDDHLHPDQIQKNWNYAAQVGTDIHEFIEAKLNGVDLPIPEIPIIGSKEYDMVNEFFEENKLDWWRTELRVYSEKYNVVGSFDGAYVTSWNEDGTPASLGLADWKRTNKIRSIPEDDPDYRKNSKQRYDGPLNHLVPSTRMDYTLQLSTYAAIIEDELNLPVTELWLGVIYGDNDKMMRIDVPYMKAEAHAMMQYVKDLEEL